MNDVILSSLINLFALLGATKGIDNEKSKEQISKYLSRHFGVRNLSHYLGLYEDLRLFYDDFPPEITIVDGICSKLLGKISADEQAMLLLRLMEFCRGQFDNDGFDDEVFRQVAKVFGIGTDTYSDFIAFISPGRKTENTLEIPYEGTDGYIKTLRIPYLNKLVFSFIGTDTVLMNDVPVLEGSFQEWQQSGVLKCKKAQPLYYSTILSKYGKSESTESIELCGRGIEFRFQKGEGGIHNLSFTLQSGQLVAIMGGSGTGKSTLLSILNGNLQPQQGSLTINGHPISEPDAKALIGFVPQDDLLVEELTVYQNLFITAKLCFSGLSDEQLDAKVNKVLEDLGLDATKDLKVGSPLEKYISGGQRKRLNIALELIREPAILFLDEPTSGLSSFDTEKVVGLLKEQTYKNKLIVVNIHQPSSDVYKLFDRLWLLDKGGYPVFDGNPIDAITYFKQAANYADADTSTCPTCGTVNPEVVLNIIDDKALDDSGKVSERRKVTPQEWHKMYLEARGDFAPAELSDVPRTNQKRPNGLKQTWIFLKRTAMTKITNLQYLLITFLEAPVLAVICAILTKYTAPEGYSVMENKNLVSYFFMAVIVAIFIGMSGSAEEIFKDRAILKREKFLSLSYPSYIWSKIVFMAGISLIQTFLFVLVGNAIMHISDMFLVWWGILFMSAFLSNLVGLLLSQCLNSVVAIYITIPILLIPQILLCGLVVKFEDLNPNSETGNVPLIGDIIPSRWAYEALATTYFVGNDYEKNFYAQDRDKFIAQFNNSVVLREIRSQLETLKDEKDKGKEIKTEHLLLIKTEMPKLAGICDVEQYEGLDSITEETFSEEDYVALNAYLDKLKKVTKKTASGHTNLLDREIGDFVKENGKEALIQAKKAHYNLQLENVVLNRDTEKTHLVVNGHIVPRFGYVFLEPDSRCGRAPFYSGVKIVGNKKIPTLWYNMGVMLLMCIILSICLFTDCPGKFVRKETN